MKEDDVYKKPLARLMFYLIIEGVLSGKKVSEITGFTKEETVQFFKENDTNKDFERRMKEVSKQKILGTDNEKPCGA